MGVKIKLLRILLLIVVYAFGLNTSSEIEKNDLSNEHSSSKISQQVEIKILIVDCQSTLYFELCDFINTFFTQEEIPHIIVKRNHDNFQDIISSKFKGFDLLIISGSSNFFPDSSEVKDVAELLKIVIEQRQYAFGVCFGLQLLAYLLDSKEGKLVKKGSWDKDVAIDILKDDLIFKNIGMKSDSFVTRQYHKYSVPFLKKGKLGQGTILAKSKDGIEIIRMGHIVATQFHPESRYASPEARCLFKNYLKEFVSTSKVLPLKETK